MEFFHQSSSVGFVLGHGHVKLSGVLVFGAVDGTNHSVLVFGGQAVQLGNVVLVDILVEAIHVDSIMRVVRIAVFKSS